MSEKVRMVDIAREAGVSIATVSLALNNHPRIPAETKNRIREICNQHGYHPNPAAKALRANDRKSTGSYLGTLAFLEEKPHEAERASPLRQHWDSHLQAVCSGMGYRLEYFAVGPTAREQKALNRILAARGIQGVLVFGYHQPIHTWQLDWDRLASVACCSSLHERFAHNVMTSSYQDMYDAVLELQRRGYQNPGYFVGSSRFDYWEAGFSRALEIRDQSPQTSPLIWKPVAYSGTVLDACAEWVRQEEPDVILSNENERLIQGLAERGIRVPDDIGYLCLDIWPGNEHLSGLIQSRGAAYNVMVDLLHGMLMRNEFGPPAKPFFLQVPSMWNEGSTLRPLL